MTAKNVFSHPEIKHFIKYMLRQFLSWPWKHKWKRNQDCRRMPFLCMQWVQCAHSTENLGNKAQQRKFFSSLFWNLCFTKNTHLDNCLSPFLGSCILFALTTVGIDQKLVSGFLYALVWNDVYLFASKDMHSRQCRNICWCGEVMHFLQNMEVFNDKIWWGLKAKPIWELNYLWT